jgi:hypothetical protein
VAVLAGACGGKSHWIEHACQVSLSSDRTAFVYVTDDAVGMKRDGKDLRVPFTGCLATGKNISKVVALQDGWSAFVYGYRTVGGSIHHSNGTMEDERACLVDFRTLTSSEIDTSLVGRLKHSELEVGAQTGRIYVLGDNARAIDLAKREAFPLGVDAKHVVEMGSVLRTVGIDLDQIHPSHPIYKHTLVITDFAPDSWPPQAASTRQTVIKGRPDELAISDDGHWVGYTGTPYYEGLESRGQVADTGLVNLDSGAITFELLAEPGDAHVGDVATTGAVPKVLVRRSSDGAYDGPVEVAWLDATGVKVSSKTMRASRVHWVPSAKRLIVSQYCEHSLVDLAP